METTTNESGKTVYSLGGVSVVYVSTHGKTNHYKVVKHGRVFFHDEPADSSDGIEEIIIALYNN